MFGLREIEATQETIRELRLAGNAGRADAVEAVLEAATASSTARGASGTHSFLTTGDAARTLGVSIQTIKNWAASGRLPLMQFGGRNVIRREDLLAYVESLRKPSDGSGPFEGQGIDDDRLRAVLPQEMVKRIDAYHEAIERGDHMTAADRAELRRLERTATRLAGSHIELAAR